MDIKTLLGILRWLLVVGLLAWGTTLGVAQTKAAQPTKPARNHPRRLPCSAGKVDRKRSPMLLDDFMFEVNASPTLSARP